MAPTQIIERLSWLLCSSENIKNTNANCVPRELWEKKTKETLNIKTTIQF